MFGVDFSEMIVIAVVALVVLGPERLPKVARTAGHLLGRLQRYVSDVKADIHREMQLEELKRLQAEIEESARSVERTLSREMDAARSVVSETAQTVATELQLPTGGDLPAGTAVPTGSAEPAKPARDP